MVKACHVQTVKYRQATQLERSGSFWCRVHFRAVVFSNILSYSLSFYFSVLFIVVVFWCFSRFQCFFPYCFFTLSRMLILSFSALVVFGHCRLNCSCRLIICISFSKVPVALFGSVVFPLIAFDWRTMQMSPTSMTPFFCFFIAPCLLSIIPFSLKNKN